jgi:2-polyprenyl-6-methoxyphenol hydroxylase-like FAD-dependent oxidoreductase
VQARTLEFYRQIGLASTVFERGREVSGANLWVEGRHVAHLEFGDMGAGISPYASAFIFPQDEHERLLVDCLAAAGVLVERDTELVTFDNGGDGVVATLKRVDGRAETMSATFIAGCDGARSRVREAIGVGFAGGTYEHLFYVADVDACGSILNGEVHVALDTADFLAVFPLTGANRARLVGTVRESAIGRGNNLAWEDVSKQVIEWLPIDIQRVNWFSTYHVHHRVADRFTQGRAFLLGDAAHVHSPVGGQGMNTGIGDAVNLAWKLAAVVHGRAPAAILDTYEPERIAFARRLVATTDRAFTAVTSSTATARAVRLHAVPWLLPPLVSLRAVKRLAFRTVSQTAITYRGSALSQGQAGAVHGGDRLPWIPIVPHGDDNFAPLTSLEWQVHIYGDASTAIRSVCSSRHLALHEFGWRPAMEAAGMARDALYLVRPDGYIGLADAEQSAACVAQYLDAHAIAPADGR